MIPDIKQNYLQTPFCVFQLVFCELIYLYAFKGIVHLNIIFSYMKVNKMCNLDHTVY